MPSLAFFMLPPVTGLKPGCVETDFDAKSMLYGTHFGPKRRAVED
jgi:hypothetical protein